MLKKRERLSRSDFNTLFKHGKRFHTGFFTLLYSDNQKEMKCGLVVSKKVAKHAVKRNKLRRKVYHILKDSKQLLNHKHLAVLTKPTITTLTSEELRKELQEAFTRLS